MVWLRVLSHEISQLALACFVLICSMTGDHVKRCLTRVEGILFVVCFCSIITIITIIIIIIISYVSSRKELI